MNSFIHKIFNSNITLGAIIHSCQQFFTNIIRLRLPLGKGCDGDVHACAHFVYLWFYCCFLGVNTPAEIVSQAESEIAMVSWDGGPKKGFCCTSVRTLAEWVTWDSSVTFLAPPNYILIFSDQLGSHALAVTPTIKRTEKSTEFPSGFGDFFIVSSRPSAFPSDLFAQQGGTR